MTSKSARNIHRAYLFEDHNMGSSLISESADFKEMSMGSVQAFWTGNDATTGSLELEASDDNIHWDNIEGSYRTLANARLSWLWDLGVIGYRYVRLVYVKVDVTSGTLTAFAIGKMSR